MPEDGKKRERSPEDKAEEQRKTEALAAYKKEWGDRRMGEKYKSELTSGLQRGESFYVIRERARAEIEKHCNDTAAKERITEKQKALFELFDSMCQAEVQRMWKGGDLYDCLTIKKNASAKDIKNNFRALSQLFHPDKTQGNKKGEEIFKALSEAYDVLGNPQKRAAYDAGGHDEVRDQEREDRGNAQFKLWFEEWMDRGNKDSLYVLAKAQLESGALFHEVEEGAQRQIERMGRGMRQTDPVFRDEALRRMREMLERVRDEVERARGGRAGARGGAGGDRGRDADPDRAARERFERDIEFLLREDNPGGYFSQVRQAFGVPYAVEDVIAAIQMNAARAINFNMPQGDRDRLNARLAQFVRAAYARFQGEKDGRARGGAGGGAGDGGRGGAGDRERERQRQEQERQEREKKEKYRLWLRTWMAGLDGEVEAQFDRSLTKRQVELFFIGRAEAEMRNLGAKLTPEEERAVADRIRETVERVDTARYERGRKQREFKLWLDRDLEQYRPGGLHEYVNDIFSKGGELNAALRQARQRVQENMDYYQVPAPERARIFERVAEQVREAWKPWEKMRREEEARRKAAEDYEAEQERKRKDIKEKYKAEMEKWIASNEQYAYEQLRDGAVYAKILESLMSLVRTRSKEDQEEYGPKMEKAVEKAWKRLAKEKKKEYEGWSGDWYRNLAAEVKKGLDANVTPARVKAALERALEEKLELIPDDSQHHGERARMNAIVDAAIEDWQRKAREKKEARNENDELYDKWAEVWVRDTLPAKAREAFRGKLALDEAKAIAAAMLGSHRVVGVADATHKKHVAAADALVTRVYAELEAERSKEPSDAERKRKQFEAWFHPWIINLPGAARKWLETNAAEKVRTVANGALDKQLELLSPGERQAYIERKEEIMNAAIVMDMWLKSLPMVSGGHFQQGRGLEAVKRFLDGQFEKKMETTARDQHDPYREKKDQILERITAAYNETIAKGEDVNAFYIRFASGK